MQFISVKALRMPLQHGPCPCDHEATLTWKRIINMRYVKLRFAQEY